MKSDFKIVAGPLQSDVLPAPVRETSDNNTRTRWRRSISIGRWLSMTILVAAAFGCASVTPYQPAGSGPFGYHDAHIKGNVYYVEVRTNYVTSHTTTMEYFNRRAKEVCSENGYSDYEIRGLKDLTTQAVAGSAIINNPQIAGYIYCTR